MTQSNDWNELFNKSLLNNLFAVYKRRPLRPPFLLVLSDGMGVTSSVNIIKTFNKHFICMELTMKAYIYKSCHNDSLYKQELSQ